MPMTMTTLRMLACAGCLSACMAAHPQIAEDDSEYPVTQVTPQLVLELQQEQTLQSRADTATAELSQRG